MLSTGALQHPARAAPCHCSSSLGLAGSHEPRQGSGLAGVQGRSRSKSDAGSNIHWVPPSPSCHSRYGEYLNNGWGYKVNTTAECCQACHDYKPVKEKSFAPCNGETLSGTLHPFASVAGEWHAAIQPPRHAGSVSSPAAPGLWHMDADRACMCHASLSHAAQLAVAKGEDKSTNPALRQQALQGTWPPSDPAPLSPPIDAVWTYCDGSNSLCKPGHCWLKYQVTWALAWADSTPGVARRQDGSTPGGA